METFNGKDNEDDSFSKKFIKEGSYWYNNTSVNPGNPADWYNEGGLWADGNSNSYNAATGTEEVEETRYVTHVLLGETDYVTIGALTDETAATKSNIIDIKVGAQNIYVPTTMADGAYLLQNVKTGKYLVDNLRGGIEEMEQAVRQNFQHMPAAQWIVESNGNATTVTNREFENVYRNGILYKGAASDQAFFYGDAQYKFIKVEDADNPILGYKWIDDEELNETRFSFNYLHDLAMDKPINTINTKDSVVWVDKDGEAMSFSLEEVVVDEYGYNGGIKGIAQLKRRVYKIKVNDANKLVNNHRYLHYDSDQKKYVVSATWADYFLLKENNEVEGSDCYYTFLRANLSYAGTLNKNNLTVAKVGNDYYFYANAVDNVKLYVTDDDVATYYPATNAKVINTSGVLIDGEKPNYTFVSANNLTNVIYLNENQGNAFGLENDKDGFKYNNTNEQWEKTWSDGTVDYVAFVPLNTSNANYAEYKVSVDNNTLALVNGVLNDSYSNEVANSAFAVKHAESQLYRHIADVDTVKVFRVNSTEKEYLYEDATSRYSKDFGFNFLGVEDKGLTKNPAMFLDTAYVNRGTIMPQYMFVLRPTIQEADTIWCNATAAHKHETLADSLACEHTTVLPKCVKGYYLVNLTDSVDAENDRIANGEGGILTNKYLLDNTRYVRLGFVPATHIGDSLIIENSIYTGDNRQINPGDSTTYASRDTIDLSKNEHNNVAFSLRLIDDSDDFLIESEGTKKAPTYGGWIKIQNGVPVIANGNYAEAVHEAEVFNLETTLESPTANDAIATSEVSIVAVQGAVVVKGAAGKKVAISNILGQNIANAVLSSDNETIAAPAGIVVVAVEGEEAVKAVVK